MLETLKTYRLFTKHRPRNNNVKSSTNHANNIPQRMIHTNQTALSPQCGSSTEHGLLPVTDLAPLTGRSDTCQVAQCKTSGKRFTPNPSAGLLRVLSATLFFPKSFQWDNRKQLLDFEEEKGKIHKEIQVCHDEQMTCLERQRAG